jgi:hypothetical protein
MYTPFRISSPFIPDGFVKSPFSLPWWEGMKERGREFLPFFEVIILDLIAEFL